MSTVKQVLLAKIVKKVKREELSVKIFYKSSIKSHFPLIILSNKPSLLYCSHLSKFHKVLSQGHQLE